MKNVIKFIVITIILIAFSYFINELVNNTPEYLSERMINILFTLKSIIDFPLKLFSFVFSSDFVDDNHMIFCSIVAVLIALIITSMISDESNNDYDEFLKKRRPYILTEYEDSNKEKKENMLPFNKKEKCLDKLGLLKRTSIEKEIFYNVSIYLPDEIRKVFSYQVKKIQRTDRFKLEGEDNEVYAFFSFKSFFGINVLKNVFPQNMLEMNGNKNNFVLATVTFKDRDHNILFADVWVKNLKLEKIVFKSNSKIDPNFNYDFSLSGTKINIIAKTKNN